MPLISIIMATFNCEDTLCTAIESIIKQTYKNWELVICDDCSTDRTWNILQEYKVKYPEKITLIRNDVNSKLPYSLNQCLKYSKGEYVARMDADDISLPERLEKQLKYLEHHSEYDVVGCSMIRFDENGDYDIYYSVEEPNKFTLLKEVPYCHATIMMRKKAYDSINGYTVSKRTERGQDLDLWFRFYEAGFKGNNLHEPLYKVYEGREAIKRRKLKFAIYATWTKLIGFRKLHFPVYNYIYAFVPVVSYFIPRSLKLSIRRKKA